jgi:hypothetical protein
MWCAGCDKSLSWFVSNDSVSLVGVCRKMGNMQEYEDLIDIMPRNWSVYRGQVYVFLCCSCCKERRFHEALDVLFEDAHAEPDADATQDA